MCFYIDEKHPDKKIAKRNIVCYKVLNDDMFSVFQNFKYTYNRLYHNKRNANLEILKTSSIFVEKKYYIVKGYHSYSNKDKAYYTPEFNPRYRIIVKCIIPKGSEYYYNSLYKEYVSNQIILQEIIKHSNN